MAAEGGNVEIIAGRVAVHDEENLDAQRLPDSRDFKKTTAGQP